MALPCYTKNPIPIVDVPLLGWQIYSNLYFLSNIQKSYKKNLKNFMFLSPTSSVSNPRRVVRSGYRGKETNDNMSRGNFQGWWISSLFLFWCWVSYVYKNSIHTCKKAFYFYLNHYYISIGYMWTICSGSLYIFFSNMKSDSVSTTIISHTALMITKLVFITVIILNLMKCD